MKNAFWLGLVVVIVVVAIGFYGWQAQAPTEPIDEEPIATTSVVTTTPTTAASSTSAPTTAAVAGDVTIAITDTGFEPSVVTVAPNTTVTFVNNGQGTHWPASGPHPTHTALAGFDAKRALQTGEKYSFTFTKSGTWSFHDHVHENLSGQIIVK